MSHLLPSAPAVHKSSRSTRFLPFSFLALLFALHTCPASAVTGYVRVSQIGYESGLCGRAFLMTTAAVSGVSFAVKNSGGTTVASGSVGATTGKWATYSVYPIDFNVSAAGTYTVSVSGGVSATSPAFRIDTAAQLYGDALGNTLSFYQVQRDGPNFVPSELRTAAGHLNDKKATVYQTPAFNANDNIKGSGLTATGATIDASGGWWDAGDYLKFVQTASYTEALMLIGVRDFPNQMGSGSATSNFTSEAKFGLDWLQKMWDDSSKTLYYQVGTGSDFTAANYQSDHDIWRLPQDDDNYGGTDSTFKFIRNRPVFIAAAAGSKISPNLAGRLAADFALCFRVYQSTNPAYANQCLLSAEHIFDLANTSPGTLLTVAPYDFYGETEWREDLELGAAELYFALQAGNLPGGLPHTDPTYYLQQSSNWAYAYIHGPGDAGDSLNLYDVSGLSHFELHRAITLAGNPGGLKVSQADLLADMLKELSAASTQAGKDPFGFGFDWSAGDTTSHGAGLSVEAKEYYYLTNTSAYATDSRRWLANIMGANAWGISLIVGDGSTFPDCTQHQVANLVGSTNGVPPVLAGAAVEGPNNSSSSGLIDKMVTCPTGGGDAYKKFNGNGAVYKDNVQSYSTDEPAIDLTASSMLMFSWRIAGSPSGTP